MSTDQEYPVEVAAQQPGLDRVVIGVDFSAPSLAAADWVRMHFAPEASSVLVHAIHIPKPPGFLRSSFPSRDEVLTSARSGASTRLSRIRDTHGWGDIGIDVRDGRAENAIAAAASETDADIVVVGEHARPRGIWTTLGSTAEALVRCSPVPVLLVRSAPDNPPARILVAVDDSERGLAALRWGALLAKRFEAEQTAFHAFRPVYLGIARSVSGTQAAASLERQQLSQTERWLEQYVHDAKLGASVTTSVERGDPASALVAFQRGGEYDLVVIGSRGAGGVGRMLLGSVASGVLRGASCPVLVVR